MRRHRHTIIRSFVLAAVMTAALASSAAAEDLRSPDARDQASPAQETVDLRSPDALDAATPAPVDLRSPDAGLPVRLPTARPVTGTSQDTGDFDLLSAVIGAGTVLALALTSVGVMGALGRRRRNASRRGVAPAGG